MNYTLRPYQQNASDAAWAWIRTSLEPCLIEAATGAGKSLLVTDLAHRFHKASGKSTLCIAPSQELVEQNYMKYLLTGEPASIYCASLGKKDLRHPVVFASPQTFIKVAEKVGERYGLIIVDECQGMTETVRKIIEDIRKQNPKVRVVGLTGTPYVLGDGYIYRMDENGKAMSDEQARDPYFMKKVYSILARELIDLGYLTPPVIGSLGQEAYDTSGIDFSASKAEVERQIDRAFMGDGRKTAAIVSDIVYQSRDKRGVMIFASTIQHAQEVMRSLPPELSRMVTGNPKITSKAYRKQAIEDFKAQKFKYLVNVAVLTTGFDAPHVDVIAILRKTESRGLLQQIIGRGLRLYEGKDHVLILDYAENLEEHCPDGDIFKPDVKASLGGTSGTPADFVCPQCKFTNQFSLRKNDEGYAIDEHGYFTDLAGDRILVDSTELDDQGQPKKLAMPAHFGRRCQAFHKHSDGFSYQCTYRWSSKPCPNDDCGHDNDIAARYCKECKCELIDPNSKLRIEFKRQKKDPYQAQCDEVIGMQYKHCVSRNGNAQCMVTYTTPYRTFTIYYQTASSNNWLAAQWQKFQHATDNLNEWPQTVTYQKDPTSGMFKVIAYNQQADTDGL
ncbi:DNA repair helicase [Pseudomonas phage DDSR119]|nr:DNA repair helicase [Pseudomonas phage DDSR119]